MPFYTTEHLGLSRRKTPEGYTVCLGVPIARTGEQLYEASEIYSRDEIRGDPNRTIRVQRLPEDVFSPATLASGEGKDVLLDHPTDGKLVDPRTWRELTMGTMQNVRRGEGDRDHLTLADLVVKAPEAIAEIDAIRPGDEIQVSAGYDAEYEDLGNDTARQRNILFNHTAILLTGKGRCGPACAITDSLPARVAQRSKTMAAVTLDRARPAKLRRFMDRFRKAVSTNDAEELGRLAEEGESMAGEEGYTERAAPADPGDASELHVHVHTGDAEEEPDDMTGMDRRPARDARRRSRDAVDPDTGIVPPEETGEPDGDEPATKADIAQVLMCLNELMDADDEGEDLDGEEAEGGEVADRRVRVRDRRRKARDAIRHHAKRFMDEIGEIVMTKHNPDSTGRNDAPGTAGAGKTGIKSEPVHRAATGDRAVVMDSRNLQPEWDLVMSRAEILSPGIQVYESGRPVTFDAATRADVTERRICALRRRSLDAALTTQDGQAAVHEVTAGRRLDLRTATCDSIAPIFNAASALMAARNREHNTVRSVFTADAARTGIAVTPADINKRNRERDAIRRLAAGIRV